MKDIRNEKQLGKLIFEMDIYTQILEASAVDFDSNPEFGYKAEIFRMALQGLKEKLAEADLYVD